MKTSGLLTIGKLYTRKDLRKMFGITDATINTGIFRPKQHESIWLFVTEKQTSDRPQYSNLLENDILHWDGQTSGRKDDWIIYHKQHGMELIAFYRKRKDEHPGAAFRYEGVFEYVSHVGKRPTHFILRKSMDLESLVMADIEAYRAEEMIERGEGVKRFVNRYERNPRIRVAAIRIHGTKCMACGFDFESVYGDRGKGFIEVHHIVPISTLAEDMVVDPEKDMIVLCANCHRMIHRRKDDILSLNELKRIIEQSGG